MTEPSPTSPTTRSSDGLPPLPPPAPSPPAIEVRTPRAGELAPGWRVVTALTWIGVVLALTAVWRSSAQLGLSTWWLGPRAAPRPRVVQLTPFVGPILMIVGTINQVRWLGWYGLGASGVIAAYGLVDLGSVTSLAVLQLLIAAAAAAVSLASLTGTYRRAPDTVAHPDSG